MLGLIPPGPKFVEGHVSFPDSSQQVWTIVRRFVISQNSNSAVRVIESSHSQYQFRLRECAMSVSCTRYR